MRKTTPITNANILVIGAGVSGLTTAICLRYAGFKVTVVADNFAPDLTSIVAGALWEWPPAVCGHHGAPRSLERSKKWCMTSYQKFKQIYTDFGPEETGIYLRDVYFYFKDVLENQPFDLNKMNELKNKVDGFERGLQIVKDSIDLNFQGGIKDAYKHMSPMVNTDVYMKWLLKHAIEIGCEILQEKITVNVVENEQELLHRFNAKAIINCAGLGSIVTTGDSSIHPLRGALVRVKNQGGVVQDAHCISSRSTNEQDIIFIVPRGDDLVVLGGLAQPDEWNTELSLDIPIIRQMYDGCLQFLEELRDLPLDPEEPVRTGLRPCTEKNVCLERVPNTKIFYNYGHGGSGVTLSWGCAEEIVGLVKDSIYLEANSFVSFNNKTSKYIGHDKRKKIDINQKTVFMLFDNLSETDFSALGFDGKNLILLCTRRGLSKIVPSQYQYLNLVRIVEPFNLVEILRTYKQIKTDFGISERNCQALTNEPQLMLVATQFDEYLMLLGSELRQGLAYIGENSSLNRQFANKDNLKLSLRNSSINLLKRIKSEQDKYHFVADLYLQFILQELGEKISVTTTDGTSYNGTKIIHSKVELEKWCEENLYSNNEFEFSPLSHNNQYSVSIVIKDGKFCYFGICKNFYGNSSICAEGYIVLREEEPEFEKLRQFSIEVLENLKHGYSCNGVINIDIFLPANEEPILINVTPGSPGIHKSKIFEIYQGIKLNELHLQLQIDSPEIRLKDRKDWKYSACSIHPKKNGIITQIEKPMFISDAEINWYIHPGGVISQSDDPAIAIVLNNKNYSVLELDLEVALHTDFYKINNNNLLQLNKLRKKNDTVSRKFYDNAGGSGIVQNLIKG